MPVRLTIDFDETTNTVKVDGPLPNALLCYGMIEMAKDAIRAYANAEASRIVRVPMGAAVPPAHRNGDGVKTGG